MSASHLKFEDIYVSHSNGMGTSRSSRQSLKHKFEKERRLSKNSDFEYRSRRNSSNWCDAFSLAVPNRRTKQAWKNGTEKLSQTFNNVRLTFGSLSRKIKKSTKNRQALINLDTPQTPITPHTKSRTLLGRTPTKLYSPFHIDTPEGKENVNCWQEPLKNKSSKERNLLSLRRKCKQSFNTPSFKENDGFYFPPFELKLANDLLQTQLGVYEFQSIASKIVQNKKP